jgi:hypothetical protein
MDNDKSVDKEKGHVYQFGERDRHEQDFPAQHMDKN